MTHADCARCGYTKHAHDNDEGYYNICDSFVERVEGKPLRDDDPRAAELERLRAEVVDRDMRIERLKESLNRAELRELAALAELDEVRAALRALDDGKE